MYADHLPRCRSRPMRIPLRNAIDCLVVNVNEFTGSGTGRIHAVDFSISVLAPFTSRRANPIILSDNDGTVGYRIAIWWASKVRLNAGSFVVLGDLVSVKEIN